MDRKLALMNKRQSQWHRTAGMEPLKLNAKVAEGVWLRVEQTSDPILGIQIQHEVCGPGVYDLECMAWSRISIVDDAVQQVLCFFQTGGLSAVSSS